MPHLQSILYEITLPLMLITDKEVQTWGDNQIEYVRLQVDNNNAWNVKRTNQDLIKAICNIRPTRKMKISNYLTGYLNVIVESMQN
jgi:t-SNARE complex subunit (syntaxin)